MTEGCERQLHHWTLDPFARSVRLALAEKGLAAKLVHTPPWELETHAHELNPIGGAPVYVEQRSHGRLVFAEPRAILEYLNEAYPQPSLMPEDRVERAEARWVMGWLERGFDRDVNQTLLNERVLQRCLRAGTPNSALMRKGAGQLRGYMRHVDAIAGVRPFLAGEHFSLADLSLAAHLSCLDYFADVPWADFTLAHDWYLRMKSRPSFRSLLADELPGVAPAPHYADLDG